MEAKIVNSDEQLTKKEMAWYIGAGVLALAGITLLIIGIISYYLGPDNAIAKAEESIGLAIGFRGLGIILLSCALILAVIVLCVNARKTDRYYEKKVRRQQRKSSNVIDASIAKESVQTIENPEQIPEQK